MRYLIVAFLMASGLMGSIFAGVPPVTDKATVYASKTGRKFHASESCFSLRRATVHSLTLADAKLAGLTPCGLCYRSETPKGDKAGKQ